VPYLTPDEIPEATSCRSLLIPDSPDWLAIVSGAINELGQEWNWEQQGSVTPEEASQAMLQMWLAFVQSECGGGACPRIFRVNISGVFEESTDGGETWTAPSGDATVPPTPAREEPTEQERRCLAAANAANVLAQTYEQMLDAWQLDQSVTYGQSVWVATLTGLIGVWLGVISAGAINLALGVFAAAYEILSNLTQDAWDVDFNDKLTCVLLNAASDNAGVVTFNYQEFLTGLNEIAASNPIEQALLVAQINYMMLWIGADGLNAAGATTAITEHDCSDCGLWCYTMDFTIDDFDWSPVTLNGFTAAQYNVGVGWGSQDINNGVNAYSRISDITLTFPEAIVTGIELTFQLTKGTFQTNNTLWSIADENAGLASEVASSVANGGQTKQWVGERSMSQITVWARSSLRSSALYNGSITLLRVTLSGIGENPFGSDNC